jgi:hypothetical protein
MPLPPGLSPVDAGRFGLWLLGKRNHRAAERRRRSSFRAYSGTLLSRFASIVSPWKVYEYPGAEVLIGRLCGVSEGRAHNLLCQRGAELPSHHARVLADYVERFDGPAVARELRTYAAERDKKIKPRRVRVRQVGRDGGDLGAVNEGGAREVVCGAEGHE